MKEHKQSTRATSKYLRTAADLIHYVQAKAIIIGPETPVEAQFVIQIGQSAHVPIIAYSATSPWLSSMRSRYFIRASQDDLSQVNAISALMQAYEWRQAVPIYADSEFGGGPYLADALREMRIRIPNRSVIPSSASDDGIALELDKLTKMETRVFIVHMDITLGRRLFSVAKKKGMMTGGYVWIITSGMASKLLDSADPDRVDLARSMQGVLGVKSYVPASYKRNRFEGRWRKKFRQHPALMMQINVYGIWAYDAATALALAVEKVVVDEADQAGGTNNLKLMKAARDVDNNSDSADSPSLSDALSALARGVSASQQQVGGRLLEAILSTKFTGISGPNYDLAAGGQLQYPSVFELINILGDGTAARLQTRIGYWTRDLGLARELNSTDRSRQKGALYSTLRENLTDISLPGYAKPIGKDDTIPKGWKIIPTNGSRKLRIGVPEKDGFTDFVKVAYDGKKVIDITGYCIDVFDAVMLVAGYEKDKDYEYVPYVNDGDSEGYYDRLIQQVPQKVYDAVVGDVTIVYNRSQYVEFTSPYKESGVIMVEPIAEETPWFFASPLSPKLWATTFCLFIFIAFVIWTLEYHINLQFRGGPSTHQAGTGLYHSFSSLVFAHEQHAFGNLARLVVIVWVFVIFILSQSYTASLASILTEERLRPRVGRIEELLHTNKSIGYQKGSFVRVLLQQMQFNKSQLKSYGSVYEMHRLFSDEEIDVAFDEIAFVKLLISSTTRTTKCGGTPKYTMVGPIHRTDGFGFVFPKHSPLALYVSRAVLNVTQGKNMTNITKKWFPKQEDEGCSDGADSTTITCTITSTSIGLKSFWGLFVMAGSVALFALLISVLCFLYEHRHVWLRQHPADAASSITTRITDLLWIFDQPNLHSPTFRTMQGTTRHGEPRHSSTS